MTMNLSQAAEFLGMAQPTLSIWLLSGLVTPPDWQRRQGVKVSIGAKQLRELMAIRDLRRAGVSMQAIRRAADTLRKLGANPFSRGRFIAVDHGREVIRVVGQEEATALLEQPGQLVLSLPEDPAI